MESLELEHWKKWQISKCISSKEFLFFKYQHWAEIEAVSWYKRVFSQGAEILDFIHFAHEGLLESINKFDPYKGNKFETYARFRIKGCILNRVFSFSEGKQEFITLESSFPDFEINNEDKLDFSEMVLNLSISYMLKQPVVNTPELPSLNSNPYTSPEMSLLKEKTITFVDKLDQPMQSIIKLYYFQDMSFVDIAQYLEVTKGRVSQLHKQALHELKTLL